MGDASIYTVPILDMEEDVIKQGVATIAEKLIEEWKKNYVGNGTVDVNPYELFVPDFWLSNPAAVYIQKRVQGTTVASAAARAAAASVFPDTTTDSAASPPPDTVKNKDKVLRFLIEFDNATNDLTRRRYAVYIHLSVLYGMGVRKVGDVSTPYVNLTPTKDTTASNRLLFGTADPPATSLSDTNARAVRKALRREERRRNSLDERLGDREDEESGAARTFWASLAVFCILAGLIFAAQTGLVGVTRSAAVLLGVVAVVAAVGGLSWTTLRQDILD